MGNNDKDGIYLTKGRVALIAGAITIIMFFIVIPVREYMILQSRVSVNELKLDEGRKFFDKAQANYDRQLAAQAARDKQQEQVMQDLSVRESANMAKVFSALDEMRADIKEIKQEIKQKE